MSSVVVTVRMPVELRDRLKAEAKDLRMSFSQWVLAHLDGTYTFEAEQERRRAKGFSGLPVHRESAEVVAEAGPVREGFATPPSSAQGREIETLAKADCAHPVNKRIGDHCMLCDSKVGK